MRGVTIPAAYSKLFTEKPARSSPVRVYAGYPTKSLPKYGRKAPRDRAAVCRPKHKAQHGRACPAGRGRSRPISLTGRLSGRQSGWVLKHRLTRHCCVLHWIWQQVVRHQGNTAPPSCAGYWGWTDYFPADCLLYAVSLHVFFSETLFHPVTEQLICIHEIPNFCAHNAELRYNDNA